MVSHFLRDELRSRRCSNLSFVGIRNRQVTAALPMNAINVIAPYKHHDMWVFDDPRAVPIETIDLISSEERLP
jgi:hypothetical protein